MGVYNKGEDSTCERKNERHALHADKLIKQLYEQRKERLEKTEICIPLDELLKMYDY